MGFFVLFLYSVVRIFASAGKKKGALGTMGK